MHRYFAFVALVALLLAVAGGRPACAQSAFAFSIGSGGGYHHHHHHGGWRFGYATAPWWGPGWYAPPPAVIYAPPPVVQDRVIYVQPQSPPPPPAAMSPYSSSASQPAANVAASPAAVTGSTSADDRIVIRNTAGAQLPVAFIVDGQDVELADGSTRTFVGKTQRTVQYDRGGKFGSTQQELTGGQYEFRITATGWDLVRRAEAAGSRTAVRANSLPSGSTR
jgi:hypothetical protein